jgi:3-hydroxyacyl-[acyl-carrier-protein] dehydratase
MLLDDFFWVDSLDLEGDSATAVLGLNTRHIIYDGHFPGRPVVPGTCLLQMVQEMTTMITCREWQLMKADQLKFIVMIDPAGAGNLRMRITCKEEGEGEGGGRGGEAEGARKLRVTADLSKEGVACFKFKGVFRPV